MFKNLKAEMIKQDVSIKQVADVLNVKVDTARLKLNGKIPLRLEECQIVAELFAGNNSLDYLFAKNSKYKISHKFDYF